ncbi:hypothetical protein VOLCADRAFT_119868 [Volvox carteri f. nagariensis]|uniref:Protein kinase domain-containing protein n=1 Tax=Volvox carteri f. nagariensis TaxID=3068 RepID=D8UHK7_VOLCA|nr:uncharacterized protein VOLCADRAFT_119868 [Volvox carteri f. nagariensis]EFJ40791.1 hypothetical protein VOLCADRAFT_119868 [Volvox carteri f. nagariensis]|eukprot:XP_002958166.1 hypothetical protein VOLCADRAFT_119868 [Volvox carteri f. nagariensis]
MTLLGGRAATEWLAMCFGACLPADYTAFTDKEPVERRPKRPKTSWRELPLLSKYELVKPIGRGGFSEIWLAERLNDSRTKVAIKVVDLTNPDLEAEEVGCLIAEAKFLRSLDCPFLLSCHETAANKDWLLLVLEYLSGGEIMDHLHKVMKYTEAEAAKLFAQVVSAISYLHNLNLIHRDIKPENVMFVNAVEECEALGRPLRVKVIDMGMAALYNPEKPIRGCIGTPGFVPPGRKPHSGQDIRLMTYCNKSIKEAPGLKDERFLSLSSAARELLLAMLADDPRDRPSCAEVLRHPFITAADGDAQRAHREIEISVRRRMRELAQLRRVHGLHYALRAHKPEGADHLTFLRLLDQKRVRLKGDSGGFIRHSDAFMRTSAAEGSGGGGGVIGFCRSSLALSYATPPPVLLMSIPQSQPPATCAAVAAAAAAAWDPTATTSSSHHHSPPPMLQPIKEQPTLTSGSLPGVARKTKGLQEAAAFSLPSSGPATDGCNTHDAAQQSKPGLGAAQVPPLPGRLPAAAAAASRPTSSGGDLSARGGSAHNKQQHQHKVMIDPMAVVNALPTLQHCTSADALTLPGARGVVVVRGGSDDGCSDGAVGDRAPGGASPVASTALLDQALVRCMSANPDTLELLSHRESLRKLWDQVAVGPLATEDRQALGASATGYRHSAPPAEGNVVGGGIGVGGSSSGGGGGGI